MFTIDKEGIVQCEEQTVVPLELPNFDAIKETIAKLNQPVSSTKDYIGWGHLSTPPYSILNRFGTS